MSEAFPKLQKFVRSCYSDDGVYSPASEYVLSGLCATASVALLFKNFSLLSAVSTILLILIMYLVIRTDWLPIKKVSYRVFFFGNVVTFLLVGVALVAILEPGNALADFLRPVLAVMSGTYLKIAHHSA